MNETGKSSKIDGRIIGAFLLAYGLICAFILVYTKWNLIGKGSVAEFRCDRLTERYNLLMEGRRFAFSRVSHTLGYPLYFPYIMKWFNIRDGWAMFNIAQTLGGMSVMLIYPPLIYKITNSFALALTSPFVMHFTFGDVLYLNKCSEYWGGYLE